MYYALREVMASMRWRQSSIVIVMLMPCLIQCGPSLSPQATPPPALPGTASGMTPAQNYAGEILAYLMQVVVGHEGPIPMRQAWSQRALGHPLDLAQITRVMNDAAQDKSALLVFDPNIIGLSRVMYYYNRTLNQFKGRYAFDSLYPSPELVALRLLLVRKLQQGQPISLRLLTQGTDPQGTAAAPSANIPPSSAALNSEEKRLINDVIEAAPIFDAYLRHPHIIRALRRIGAVIDDPNARVWEAQAHYRQYPCTFRAARGASPRLRIAILPSINEEFEYGLAAGDEYLTGFRPTATYRTAVAAFEQQLRQAIDTELRRAAPASGKPVGYGNPTVARTGERAKHRDVVFAPYFQRPLVIYPANAAQAVQEVCPEADFVVIVLGRDVYLSLNIDPSRDVYPAVNRLYLDIKDLKYAQVDQEVMLVSRWAAAQLRYSEQR